ncbi:ribosome biogenesis GTPase YlqF [Leptolyngbya sp. FACHB-261]|uniref:ribosome biogenesis GTPase YlqF n=1 Tax=Leptolyngbya sp. FACHB-261 TaxID=2692806 RepID=UPI0016849944|nr:ribosome biogenesis GTPase YlqF [Leptolyngbya sp. FACHB-261]MBD2102173.1 ribosome biogenesis GTPase YlqF [Leptolyngbya sp. FACHB-261]
MTTPPIQWYPGHIAKAEKALIEQLKLVDVVLEVRDARIPISSRHPQIESWIGSKARLLVLNRTDMIPDRDRQRWERWFAARGETLHYTDAQHGKGIAELLKAAQAAGAQVNQRRKGRGMLPRPVRSAVIGFPNVGKSALINRLVKRRAAESARRAGVTRQVRWIRVSDEIELLDAPGILPVKLRDQEAALKLAICDDIGEAAYDNIGVAGAAIELLSQLIPDRLIERYGLDPIHCPGGVYLEQVAEARFKGDTERVARQVLNDFRKGLLGAVALELPDPQEIA